MGFLDEERSHADLLRQRAEEALQGKLVDLDGLHTGDIQSLLHELQVHQVELTMQNDELRRAQLELVTSRDLYSDLYDFAPVGYCTIDHKDRILEVNQTLATLLGVDRGKLIHTYLSHFVNRDDQDEYYLHRQRALTDHQHQVSEIRMVKETGEKLDVRMESMIVQGDENKIRMMLSDITKQRLMEKEAQKIAAQQEVQHRLLDQREQERQEIARDLHDGPVQELTGVTFTLESMLMDNCTPELAQQLRAIQAILQEQIKELRTYAGELRPPTLAKFGLEQAIRSHANTFQEKHPELRLQLEMHQTGPLLQEATSLALFRIYQQALINIMKHARATEVVVKFDKDEHQVCLEIQDNGRGFELPENVLDLARKGHLGLIGVQERADAVGATLEITSHPGDGTLIRVKLPLHHMDTTIG
ncbi:MAG: histidine kinase [Chloroflexi bacterium]|nr:histidine kinase [Chloroflexota bacterium]